MKKIMAGGALGRLRAVLAASSLALAAKAPVLDELARRYAARRQALIEQTAAQRKAILQDKALAPEQRKAKVSALESEFKAKDAKLSDEYYAERRRQKTWKEADEARSRQAEADRLEEYRVWAAQQSRARP